MGYKVIFIGDNKSSGTSGLIPGNKYEVEDNPQTIISSETIRVKGCSSPLPKGCFKISNKFSEMWAELINSAR